MCWCRVLHCCWELPWKRNEKHLFNLHLYCCSHTQMLDANEKRFKKVSLYVSVCLCVCSALMYAVRVVVLCQLYALLAQTVGNPYINKSMWSCEMLATDDYHRHRDVMPHNPASTLTGLPAHSKVQIQKAMPSSSS